MVSNIVLKRCNTGQKQTTGKMLHVRTSLKAGDNSGICWEKEEGRCIINCCPTENGPVCRKSCYNPSLD